MAFEKGKVSNPRGRPKGAVDKKTSTLRETITQIVEKQLKSIDGLMSQLKPGEQARLLADLLKYALPTLSSINMEANVDQVTTIIVKRKGEQDQTKEVKAPAKKRTPAVEKKVQGEVKK